MTTAQKIIKNLSIAFAIFLIISIISFIISLVSGISSGFTFNSNYSINENNNYDAYLGIGLISSNLKIAFSKPILPSWTKSKNGSP